MVLKSLQEDIKNYSTWDHKDLRDLHCLLESFNKSKLTYKRVMINLQLP